MKAHHPTREALIATTVRLLETYQPHEITLELVLRESGISHGSLYHHFGAFPNLIDNALVTRFSSYVDRSIEMLTSVATSAQSREELTEALKLVTRNTQGLEQRLIRAYRLEALAQGSIHPEFGILFGRGATAPHQCHSRFGSRRTGQGSLSART
jgi:AcrR family transcriptional regulator